MMGRTMGRGLKPDIGLTRVAAVLAPWASGRRGAPVGTAATRAAGGSVTVRPAGDLHETGGSAMASPVTGRNTVASPVAGGSVVALRIGDLPETGGSAASSVAEGRQTAAWCARLVDETGSGTVLAVGLIGVLLALSLALTGVVQAQSGTSRARAGADLAALAGATALTSVHAPGDPCAMAQRVAGANRATVTSCRVEGEDVIVDAAVEVSVLGARCTATASARAGPVPESTRP